MTILDVKKLLTIQRESILPVAEEKLGIKLEQLQSGEREDKTVMQQHLFTGLGIPEFRPDDYPHLLTLIMWSHALDDIVDIRTAHEDVRAELLEHSLIRDCKEISTDEWYGLIDILAKPYIVAFPESTSLKDFVVDSEKIVEEFGEQNLDAFRSSTLRLILAGLIQTCTTQESALQAQLMEVYDKYLSREIPNIDEDFWNLSPHTRISLASSLQNMFITSFRKLSIQEINLVGIGDLLLGPLVFLANNMQEQESGLTYPEQHGHRLVAEDFVRMIDMAVDYLVINNWSQNLFEAKLQQLRSGIHFLSGGISGDTHAFDSIKEDFQTAEIIVEKYKELEQDLFAEI